MDCNKKDEDNRIKPCQSFENKKREKDEARREYMKKKHRNSPNRFDNEAKNPCLKVLLDQLG